MCSHHPPPSLPERKSADGRPDCKLGAPAASHHRTTGVNHCCPRCHDKKKPWDMARPEQVLLLEPQHELKFRGNVKAEAVGNRAGHQVANLCAVILLFLLLVDRVTLVRATWGLWKKNDSICSPAICAVAMTGEPSPCTTTC